MDGRLLDKYHRCTTESLTNWSPCIFLSEKDSPVSIYSELNQNEQKLLTVAVYGRPNSGAKITTNLKHKYNIAIGALATDVKPPNLYWF
jgi:hypothetical protein